MNSYLAIIPARGGSKGVPNKNLRELGGLPLIAWTIIQALNCDEIDRVLVSTDSPKIEATALTHGAEVPFRRPAELASDTASTEVVLLHALEALGNADYHPDAVILLQATSPLRSPGQISNAIHQFESENADSLLSVSPTADFYWRKTNPPQATHDVHHRPRRQDIKPADIWFQENGSIYITKTDYLLEKKSRLGGSISLFEMDEDQRFEIDTLADFAIIERLIELNRYRETWCLQ